MMNRHVARRIVALSAAVVVGINLGSYALLAYAALRGDIALGALAVFVGAVQGASGFRAFDDPNAHLAYAAVAVPSLLAPGGHLPGAGTRARPNDWLPSLRG